MGEPVSDAYETGKLRGKKLASVRRLLELRMRGHNKSMPAGKLGRRSANRKLTASDLMQVYQNQEAAPAHTESDSRRPGCCSSSRPSRDLLGGLDGFLTLLRAEALETMPRALAMRIAGESDD